MGSRKLMAGAVIAVAAGALGVVGITNAFAASSGTLVSAAGGKCLDVTDGSLQDGARLQIYNCFDDDGNIAQHYVRS